MNESVKHSINIDGIEVLFPHKPYDVQTEFMKKVMTCLKSGGNGLLESPTGTGKTLSLLCSTLAWLETRKATQQAARLNMAPPDANQGDLGVRNQGFISQIFSQLETAVGASIWGNSIQGNFTKIIYSSRTHAQLSQVVQELKNCSYKHVPAVVLGSRDQLCIHPEVSKLENHSAKLHQCRLKVDAKVCQFHLNMEQKLQSQPAYKDNPVLDIEDLVTLGKKHTCCPYYAARSLKTKAEIIFTPYNYLVDPKIRRAHGIDLQGNVLIFDEAHNIENVCEESMSFQIKSAELAMCINEVATVSETVSKLENNHNLESSMEIVPDFSLMELSILKVMFCELEQKIDQEAALGGEKGVTKPGSYIFEILSKIDLTRQKKDIVLDILDKVVHYLSGQNTGIWGSKGAGLQKFSDLLKVIFATSNASAQHLNNPGISKDFDLKYKVHIQTENINKQAAVKDFWVVPKTKNNKKCSWILNLWCFSPGQSMEDLMSQQAHCMILTSGTLAPLNSLASELEVPFPVRLENPHIISDKQVTVAVISKGPDNFELNSSFQHRSKPEYMTSLGRTIQQFSRLIPDGLLVFFPSYAVMKMCIDHWQESHLWENICAIKTAFVEPKGKDAFQECIEKYYKAIHEEQTKGAVLFSVCRGKVSEGLDFSDANARGVIITGLPFPPAFDPRIILKKTYLDGCKNKQGLKGHEWYKLQALRAVNQAVGRVIRHRNDYGAVLLCDSRFSDRNIQSQLSLWVRDRVKAFPAFGPALKNLRDFFRNLEGNVIKCASSIDNSSRTYTVRKNPLNVNFSREESNSSLASMSSPERLSDVLKDYMSPSGANERLSSGCVKIQTHEGKQNVFEALEKAVPVAVTQKSKDYSQESVSGNHVSKKRKLNVQLKGLYGEGEPQPEKQQDLTKKHREATITAMKSIQKLLPNSDYKTLVRAFANFKVTFNVEELASIVQKILSSLDNKTAAYQSICSVLPNSYRIKFQEYLDHCFK